MLSFKTKVLTLFIDRISDQIWSPAEEMYMMEIISGLKQVKNNTYLASFQLFDMNVNIYLKFIRLIIMLDSIKYKEWKNYPWSIFVQP